MTLQTETVGKLIMELGKSVDSTFTSFLKKKKNRNSKRKKSISVKHFVLHTEMMTGEETHLDHMRIMKKTAVQKQARKRAIQRNLLKKK